MHVVDAALPTRSETVGALLVHGVGNPKLGSIRETALALLIKRGVKADHVYEVNWNSVIFHPGDDLSGTQSGTAEAAAHPERLVVGTEYLTILSRAALDTAMLPQAAVADPARPAPARGTVVVDRLALGLAPVPGFMLLALLSMAAGLILDSHGLRRASGLIACASAALAFAVVALSLPLKDTATNLGTLRRALISFAWPLLYPLFATANLRFHWIVPVVLLFALPLGRYIPDQPVTIDGGVPHHRLLGFWAHMVGQCVIVGCVALGLILALLLYLGVRWLWPLIKVVADVVFYLGIRKYREIVVRQVEIGTLRLLQQGCTHLVFATHSLGTVITVDALRRGMNIPAEVRITLFTSGSPLRRLISRFFRAQYPPPAELYDLLRTSYRHFEWINVYRPKDPIGGSLGLTHGRDVSTGQPHCWLRAHLNYWGNSKVHRIATVAYRRVRDNRLVWGNGGGPVAPLAPAPHTPDPLTYAPPGVQWVRDSSVHVAAAGFMFLAAVLAYQKTIAPIHVAPESIKLLQERGVEADAYVRHYRYTVAVGDRSQTNDSTSVVFGDPVKGVGFAIPKLLTDFAPLEGRLLQTAKPSSGGPPPKNTPYMSSDGRFLLMKVRVKYLPNDPSIFVFVGHERTEVPRGALAGARVRFVLLAGILLMIAGPLWMFLMAPLVAPAVGSWTRAEWVVLPWYPIGRLGEAANRG